MSKKVTLIVPDDTTSLIVAYQIVESYKTISMGQTTVGTEQIKNEEVIDLSKKWEEDKSKELEE